MIKAECWSDDRCIEVKFDATKWFKKATDKEILALANCGWRGDYPADAVAHFMADHRHDVAEMFTYLGMRAKIETIGFECSVDSESALKWLAQNRKKVLKEILDTIDG